MRLASKNPSGVIDLLMRVSDGKMFDRRGEMHEDL
jgi:hypothetical protein